MSRRPGEVQRKPIPPRWWIHFFIGPTPVRLAVFVALLAVGIAATSLVIVEGQVGAEHARGNQQILDRHEALLANVRARHDDCETLNNRLRRGLRKVVYEGEKQIPLIRKAFPGLPPQFYRQSAAIYALELHLFSDDACGPYALRALPRRERARIGRELGYKAQ